jgi:hypothetical protein
MEIKSINIRIIPKEEMRPAYQDGWGDYWIDDDGILQIRAVLMPNVMFSHYIILHEYMEAIRCYRDGISLESIEKWDIEHPDHDDPGSMPDAPYHKHHMNSLMIEAVACLQDGYTWNEYDDTEPV